MEVTVGVNVVDEVPFGVNDVTAGSVEVDGVTHHHF